MNSKQLSKITGIKHKEIFDYYFFLENIIMYRKLIKCTYVHHYNGNHYLDDMSYSLVLCILIKFNKENYFSDIFNNPFKRYEVKSV